MNASEGSSMASETSQESFQGPRGTAGSAENKENLEDYETQLLGFTPKSFVSGIYNAVSEYFMKALQLLEEYLEKQYGDIMASTEVAEKMTFIRRHLVTQIDKAFDTLETYLATNIFCIPANIVLPEDQIQMDAPVSQEERGQLQQEITNMKKKILAVKLANAILKQRIQNTMELQETFDSIEECLNNAQATVRQGGVVDLHDSLRHCAHRVLATLRILSNIEMPEGQNGPTPAKMMKS
ncbi:protein MIS12 homolog [Littorina saxatilis]|uniref:Protein MIS12 homolog n=1 Tax=Littorina saxatilis TaxID=31220 RepID=A0AAN9FZV8_9CAEN